MTAQARALSRRKYVIFALVTVAFSLIVVVASLIAVDVYLHRRLATAAGLNVWGYRGPVVTPKPSGGRRVVVLGGSTTFGYGISADHTISAYLERALREPPARRGAGPVDVVNLGYNNEGAYAFRFNLESYKYLDYDVAVFYTGYNDLGGRPNTTLFRQASPVFRLTGYMPVLPVVLQEKAMLLKHGDLEAAYRGERTAFQPTLVQKTGAGALEAATTIVNSLERQLGRLSTREDQPVRVEPGQGCETAWAHYCGWIVAATEYALSNGKRVLIVGQPYIADRHIAQQAALEEMLRKRFGNEPRVRTLNLGHTIDLRDRALSFDGMHLTGEGNRRVAGALVPAVRDLLQ